MTNAATIDEHLGIEVNQLTEDRWLVRLIHLTPKDDWSNADWPRDEEVSRVIGSPVRFVSPGDGLDEAVYDRAEPAELD